MNALAWLAGSSFKDRLLIASFLGWYRQIAGYETFERQRVCTVLGTQMQLYSFLFTFHEQGHI